MAKIASFFESARISKQHPPFFDQPKMEPIHLAPKMYVGPVENCCTKLRFAIRWIAIFHNLISATVIIFPARLDMAGGGPKTLQSLALNGFRLYFIYECILCI
jgi:hypothetical protein